MNSKLLAKADEIVYGDRAKAYGHPSDNFRNIANLWNAYLYIKFQTVPAFFTPGSVNVLNEIDIAIFNILQKIARLAVNQTHEDSLVDIAGYVATIEKIIQGKVEAYETQLSKGEQQRDKTAIK